MKMARVMKSLVVLFACTIMFAANSEDAQKQDVNMLKSAGDWFEMSFGDKLVQGGKFPFEITLKNVEPNMILTCAFHWSKKGGQYGGLLKVFGRQENAENGKVYKFEPVIDAIPKNAETVKIVVHTSPTGNWDDLKNKGESKDMPVVRAEK